MASLTRQWAQKQLKKLVEAEVLGYGDAEQRYLMPERPDVG
ncbi:hypothetical protein ACFQVD_15490 [Streptosporangium amethystogenes subsp. fukuiense]|uniref:Uncharacterized protein n=1 Tax=Streptosporangium amethystogenes subsp. fukuiense TaxID=698418 RepID=A0ABW2SZI0_9ACTN